MGQQASASIPRADAEEQTMAASRRAPSEVCTAIAGRIQAWACAPRNMVSSWTRQRATYRHRPTIDSSLMEVAIPLSVSIHAASIEESLATPAGAQKQRRRMVRYKFDSASRHFVKDRQRTSKTALPTSPTPQSVTLVLGQQRLSELPAELFAEQSEAGWTLEDVLWLDLSHNVIRELPAEISMLENLTKLACGYNEITSVPSEIGDLTHLTWLDLTHNHIQHVSDRMGELTNLASLGLSDCKLQTFPECIGRLSMLVKLGLFNNMLTSIPGSVLCGLKSLTKLDLSNNLLQDLPREIGSLKALVWLNLGYNKLETIPPEVNKLIHLRELGLGHNYLTYLPDLSALQELVILPVFNNHLTQINPWVTKLRMLEKIDLSGNHITYLPAQIFQLPRLVHLNLKKNRLKQLHCSFLQMIVRPDSRHGNETTCSISPTIPTTGSAVLVALISKLVFLDLSDNELTTVPYALSRLPSLKQFRVLRNPLARTQFENPVRLPVEISLDTTTISGLIPTSLAHSTATFLPLNTITKVTTWKPQSLRTICTNVLFKQHKALSNLCALNHAENSQFSISRQGSILLDDDKSGITTVAEQKECYPNCYHNSIPILLHAPMLIERRCDQCEHRFVIDSDFFHSQLGADKVAIATSHINAESECMYLRYVSFLQMHDNRDIPFLRHFCSVACHNADFL